jgi:hypothetical protein
MLTFLVGFCGVGVPLGIKSIDLAKLLGFYLREQPNFSLKINTAAVKDFLKQFQKKSD